MPTQPTPRGRSVELAAVLHLAGVADLAAGTIADPADTADPAREAVRDVPESRGSDADPALIELVRVVDRLTRENLEMAGRLGYLQSEVQRLTETVKALQAPRSYGSVEHQNGPDSASQRAEMSPK